MQKALILSNIFLICVIAFLLLSPEEKIQAMGDVAEVAGQNSIVQSFMKAYPDAGMQGFMVSKDNVKKNIKEIRKDCGEDFPVDDYWRFEYMEPKENKTLKLWIEPETRGVVCMVKDIIEQNIRIPFGVETGEMVIDLKRGNTLNEKLYFFNINGERDFYIGIDVIEKPPYLLEIIPPAHTYKATDREPITMNVKLESSELEIAEPDVYPDDVEYREIEGIEGFVKTKPVKIRMSTPQPMPLNVYEKETHHLVLNVTASYFLGSRAYFYENKIINYTINIEKK